MIPNKQVIWDREVVLSTARSSGAGGQAVNKLETKVLLSWSPNDSDQLNSRQVSLILRHMSQYATTDGRIVMHCQESRSQLKNKEILKQRFFDLIDRALRPTKKRVDTKVPYKEKLKRRDQKKRRGEVKRNRRGPSLDE